MLSERECQQFRPLGQRLLVKRLPLPEQSQGDIYVLGRDYPTLGRVVRLGSGFTAWRGDYAISKGEIHVNDEVQWSIKPDFDQRCVIGLDWLCLETDDINVRIDDRGIARAVGNRVLLTSTETSSFFTGPESPIIVGQFRRTRWAIGEMKSVGKTAKDLFYLDSNKIIYNPSFRSELYLNNKQYFVVRDEDCIATVEDDGEFERSADEHWRS